MIRCCNKADIKSNKVATRGWDKRIVISMREYFESFWIKNISRNNMLLKSEAERRLFEYIKQFQSGDFSAKKEFVELFLYTDNWDCFVWGMRVFMAICNHDDFALLYDFLGECNDKQIEVFLAFVQESLSIQSIPVLLALYEDWEDSYIGGSIARNIREMLGENYNEDYHYSISDLAAVFDSFAKNNNLSLYYYQGQVLFMGNLTKELISTAVYCKSIEKPYFSDQIPSILSNSIGEECPVTYNTEINYETIDKLYKYVNDISALGHERGYKYFYNNRI